MSHYAYVRDIYFEVSFVDTARCVSFEPSRESHYLLMIAVRIPTYGTYSLLSRDCMTFRT